jgi:hypothetical protein
MKDKPIKSPIISSEKPTFKAPINVIEFERDWRIQRSDEDFYHYIKVKQNNVKIIINQ